MNPSSCLEVFIPLSVRVHPLGRASRLPLTVQGEGVGPKLRVDYKVTDMQDVVIRDKDCYEVREER